MPVLHYRCVSAIGIGHVRQRGGCWKIELSGDIGEGRPGVAEETRIARWKEEE